MEHIVEKVVETVRKRLGDQYTLDDLAAMARFSKYHFARMFRRVTGVSPRRFLYALRLQEAKRLLVTTSLSVADVSNQVGYSSVGTFTSRFSASVGVSPAVYRRLRGRVSSVLRGEPPDPAATGVIAGRLEWPEEAARGLDWAGRSPILVGLFRQPVPEGRPARCLLLGRPGEWSFQHVPAGRWYVLAILARGPGSARAPVTEHEAAMISINGPVRVGPEAPVAHLIVRLRPVRPVDPPILSPLAGAALTVRADSAARRLPARPSRLVAGRGAGTLAPAPG